METIEAFTEADARDLLNTHDLIAVGVRADEVRRRRHGTRTTFVRVFEVHAGAPPSALPARVSAGEIRITGRPASADAAIAAVRATASLAADMPLTGFSLADLQAAAGSGGLDALCRALREAGLQGIAEVAVDGAGDTQAGVAAARSAGLMVNRLVVSTMPADTRIALVEAARRLQQAVGGFKAFAPLPRTISIAEPTTGYDDAKQVALARLFVDNIDSIQVDWPLYGPKLAQVALTMGADDVDGVAAVDPGLLGTRRSPIEEILGNIRAASLEAFERNARFEGIGA
jgi:aminodeoxyfutalosine synthase